MAKLLYIEGSPRKERSASIAVARAFLEEYRKLHPKDEVITCDLWSRNLPPFDGDIINAKYAIMHGQPRTSAQAQAWKAVEAIISEFTQADRYLISTPMWNFSIPYRLKHYIDILVQPGYTFSVSPQEGYKGLVTGKKVTLIYARGGAYQDPAAADLDLQTKYMQTILKFIGFKDLDSVIIEPTLSGSPEEKEKLLQKAKQQAKLCAV